MSGAYRGARVTILLMAGWLAVGIYVGWILNSAPELPAALFFGFTSVVAASYGTWRMELYIREPCVIQPVRTIRLATFMVVDSTTPLQDISLRSAVTATAAAARVSTCQLRTTRSAAKYYSGPRSFNGKSHLAVSRCAR